jgi:hypothetical protein
MRLIIPMIIQTIGLNLSGAAWTDGVSNVSRPDPSGAVQVDAEHPARNRKVARNPTLLDVGIGSSGATFCSAVGQLGDREIGSLATAGQ